jgi:hypothetical protein
MQSLPALIHINEPESGIHWSRRLNVYHSSGPGAGHDVGGQIGNRAVELRLNLRCHHAIAATALAMAADTFLLIKIGAGGGTGPARGKLKRLSRQLLRCR